MYLALSCSHDTHASRRVPWLRVETDRGVGNVRGVCGVSLCEILDRRILENGVRNGLMHP